MAKHDVTWPEELEATYAAPAIVHHSYLLNYVYYQIVRLPALTDNKPYYDFVLDGYRDPEIWATHAEELLAVEAWTRERGISLVVVIFPNLTQPTETAFVTQQVEDLYRELDVQVVNLTEDFIGADPRDLIVNSVDAHPNEAVHYQVAVKLHTLLTEQTPP